MPTQMYEYQYEAPAGGDSTSEAVAAKAPPQSEATAMVPAAASKQMATTNPAANASLSLTMGGVVFSLEPCMNPDGQVTFQAMGPTGATLRLKNFTGELCVHIKSSSPTLSPAAAMAAATANGLVTDRRIRRQDSSVTPSPLELHNGTNKRATSRTTPPTSRTTDEAPTPTMTNGGQQKKNKQTTRQHATSEQVEHVVAANRNRSSPLPYHSPVVNKRSRSRVSEQQSEQNKENNHKKPKTNPLLSQQQQQQQCLPHSPIVAKSPSLTQQDEEEEEMLQSPNMLLSQQSGHDDDDDDEPEDSSLNRNNSSYIDCSQTLPSSGSQRSIATDDDDDDDDEDQEKPSSPKEPELLNEQEDEEMEEEKGMEEAAEVEEEEKSVATLNPDDDEEEELEEPKASENDDAVMKDADPQEKETTETLPNESPAETEGAAATETSMVVTTPPPMHEPPAPRWGHTMTMIDHNRILVYGGQSFQETEKDGVLPRTMADIHVFEIDKQKWFQPIQSDDASRQLPRQWHSSTFLPDRQLLLCFGGEAMHPKTGRVTTSDTNCLYCLDTEILLWYPPQVSGDVPSGRSGHCATLLPASSNSEIVLFGGVKASKFLNTVSVLDTNKWMWYTPKVQGVAPKARTYASATAIMASQCGSATDNISNRKNATINIRQRIIIFGGNDANRSFNTVHVLEKIEGSESSWRWFHPTVTGSPPKPRTGHSATLLADQKTICIYGGWDVSEDAEDIFEDCFLLDTESWSWKKGPKPVFAGHSLDASLGSDGGVRRVGHRAVLNTTNKEGNNEVLVFGGRIPDDEFDGTFSTISIPL